MTAITVAQLHEQLSSAEPPQLVFVAPGVGFAEGHIPGSSHFPDLASALEALRPDRPIVVYCGEDACWASRRLAQWLTREGFADARWLLGGYQAWTDAGYATTTAATSDPRAHRANGGGQD